MSQVEDLNASNINQSRLGDQSVWITKRNYQQKQKDLEHLQNRIQQLQKEEQLAQKKILDTKVKANKIFQNKKRNEEINKRKQNFQVSDANFQSLMQKRSTELREIQKQERLKAKLERQDLKKRQADEIKMYSQKISDTISKSKVDVFNEKRNKHERVKQTLQVAKQNNMSYWEERFNFFQNQNEQEKMDLMQACDEKEKLISKLERQEEKILQRLQYTQNEHSTALNQLDKIISSKASDFEKEYGPVQVNSKSTKSSNKRVLRGHQSQPFFKGSTTMQPKKYKPFLENQSKLNNYSSVAKKSQKVSKSLASKDILQTQQVSDSQNQLKDDNDNNNVNINSQQNVQSSNQAEFKQNQPEQKNEQSQLFSKQSLDKKQENAKTQDQQKQNTENGQQQQEQQQQQQQKQQPLSSRNKVEDSENNDKNEKQQQQNNHEDSNNQKPKESNNNSKNQLSSNNLKEMVQQKVENTVEEKSNQNQEKKENLEQAASNNNDLVNNVQDNLNQEIEYNF